MSKLRSDVSGKECWHLEKRTVMRAGYRTGREVGNKNLAVH